MDCLVDKVKVGAGDLVLFLAAGLDVVRHIRDRERDISLHQSVYATTDSVDLDAAIVSVSEHQLSGFRRVEAAF